MSKHWLKHSFAAFAAVCMPAVASSADAWPAKPITLVVGYAAGASTDFVARETADFLNKELGVPVIVENRPGANTQIATDFVARAKPDGYTLLVTNSSNATNPWVYKELRSTIKKDFVNIGLVGIAYNLVSASPSLGIKNLNDLVGYARANPGKFSYGSVGIGSSQHLLVSYIAEKTGIELNHIPYKGAMAALTDVVGGNLSGMIGTITSQGPFVKKGDLQPLFVTSPERSKFLPQVETLAEHNLISVKSGYWLGISGPKGMPDSAVLKINAALNKMVADPDVLARLDKQAIDPLGGTPRDMDKFFDEELEFWRVAAKAANIDPM